MTERERLIELIKNAQFKHLNLMWCEAVMLADELLENGVIVPPCKVGDDVYEVDNGGRIYGSTIRRITYETPHIGFDETAIGKSVFLNYDEAVAKAKEREK